MNKYKKYHEIRVQIAELEAERRALESELINDISLNTDSGKDLETEFATFTVSSSKTWSYSDEATEKLLEIKMEKQRLSEAEKIIKKKDEITGKAVQGKSKAMLRWKSK